MIGLDAEAADGPVDDRGAAAAVDPQAPDPVAGPRQREVIRHASRSSPGPGPCGPRGPGRSRRPGPRPAILGAMGRPSTAIRPDRIGSTPQSARASSVRPEPTSPARPSTSPARSSKLTPCTASFMQILDRQDDRAGVAVRARGRRGHVAADHQPDQLVGRDSRASWVPTFRPSRKHGDPVGQPADLLQPVRDVDDAHALRRAVGRAGPAASRPRAATATRSARPGPGSAPDRQRRAISTSCRRATLRPPTGRGPGRSPACPARRPGPRPRRPGDGDRPARPDGSARGPAGCSRPPRGSGPATAPGGSAGCPADPASAASRISTGRPSSSIVPASGRTIAAQHLDQRRLPGAVLAQKRVDLAGLQVEIDPRPAPPRRQTASSDHESTTVERGEQGRSCWSADGLEDGNTKPRITRIIRRAGSVSDESVRGHYS